MAERTSRDVCERTPAALLGALAAEKRRLDDDLSQALARFVEYEEVYNVRIKTADAAELANLRAERSRLEETLGVEALVERIDDLTRQMAELQV